MAVVKTGGRRQRQIAKAEKKSRGKGPSIKAVGKSAGRIKDS